MMLLGLSNVLLYVNPRLREVYVNSHQCVVLSVIASRYLKLNCNLLL